MTREEHIARAMLLGMVYDWRDGTYCPSNGDGMAMANGCLDCLTLEPIELAEMSRQSEPL